MRAKEFTTEVQGTLGNALRGLAATSAQQASQTKNLNAKQTGISAQTAQPSVAPTQAQSGGTTTQQNGLAAVSQEPAGQPKGFMDVLKGGVKNLAGQAVGKAMSGLGLGGTAQAIAKTIDPASDFAKMPAQDASKAFDLQKGKTLKVDQIGDITVKKVDPLKGIQLDTSKTNLGVPEINVDLKQLAKLK